MTPPVPASRTMVVGYDGSPASRVAVEHAIDAAGDAGCVIIVHAYDLPPEHVGARYYTEMLHSAASRAAQLVDDLERTCQRLRDVAHERELVFGWPAQAICDVAAQREAARIYVGSRGVGRQRSWMIGGVAHEVIDRAGCPVVVIPQRMVHTHGEGLTERAAARP